MTFKISLITSDQEGPEITQDYNKYGIIRTLIDPIVVHKKSTFYTNNQ